MVGEYSATPQSDGVTIYCLLTTVYRLPFTALPVRKSVCECGRMAYAMK
jgi:hypothetical protein